jgi:hypothetical protein
VHTTVRIILRITGGGIGEKEFLTLSFVTKVLQINRNTVKKAPSTPCSDRKTYSPWERMRIILLSFYQRLLKNYKRTIGRNC